jgi:hypothetical protein
MLPINSDTRKGIPLFSGLVCYFPHALAAVAQLSRIGNDQHSPGQPLHWAKDKSPDEPDCILRHLVEYAVDREHRDPDGTLAAVKVAWRALALVERLYDSGVDVFQATLVATAVQSIGETECPQNLKPEPEYVCAEGWRLLEPDEVVPSHARFWISEACTSAAPETLRLGWSKCYPSGEPCEPCGVIAANNQIGGRVRDFPAFQFAVPVPENLVPPPYEPVPPTYEDVPPAYEPVPSRGWDLGSRPCIDDGDWPF